jgi:hypothetical protein
VLLCIGTGCNKNERRLQSHVAFSSLGRGGISNHTLFPAVASSGLHAASGNRLLNPLRE